MNSSDQHLVQKSASMAGESLGLIEWVDDILLLKVFRELYLLMGGDSMLMRHWMQTQNSHLEGKVPANLITTTEGTEKLISLLEWYNQ